MNAPERPSSRMYESSMVVHLIWRETHTPATVRAVAAKMELGTHATRKHLTAAIRNGLIEQRADRSFWPVEHCVCKSCGARHVAEKVSA